MRPALLRLVSQALPARGVVPPPAVETEVLPQQPGRSVSGHQRSLDRQRTRAAERVDQGAAAGGDRGPAGAQQDRGREILLEGSGNLPRAVSAPVQALARQVDAQRGDRTVDARVDAHRRLNDIHRRAAAGGLAELVDDGVLYALGRVAGVQRARIGRYLHGQGIVGA